MSVHRYSPKKLLPDYLRGMAGLAICLGCLALAPQAPVVLVILGGLALLFGLLIAQTILRQRARIEVTEDGLRTAQNGPLSAWQDLRGLRLRYFSMRRNKPGGWMELKLAFPARRISVDSAIDGFDEIVAAAARAAAVHGLTVDDATRGNLAAMGHVVNGAESPAAVGAGARR
jgi:hypothetical protein